MSAGNAGNKPDDEVDDVGHDNAVYVRRLVCGSARRWDCLFGSFGPLTLAQPDARAAAIPVDEFLPPLGLKVTAARRHTMAALVGPNLPFMLALQFRFIAAFSTRCCH